MRRLYLSNNRISDVGRATFGTMTRIGTIDLSKNLIKKVDYQMFHQLQYAEVPAVKIGIPLVTCEIESNLDCLLYR